MTLIALLLIASAQPAANAVEDLALKGSLSQGGMIIGRADPGAVIELDGAAVPTSADGDFVFGFGRDAGALAKLSVTHDGTTTDYTLEIAQREYPTERVDGLPQETVTPSPESKARIAREAEMVYLARHHDNDRLDFAAGFLRPASGRISGVYGSQRILNGIPKRPHYGLDIAAPTGTPVYAPAAGIVRLAHDMLLSGGTLIIDHGMGISSTFIHLSAYEVAPGEQVAAGQLIGRIGATGRATGPHLDWRINWRNVRLDPALLLDAADLQ